MYYAVKVGRETGIFYTWAECEKPLKPNIELCQSCKEKRKKRKLSTNQMIAIKHLHPKEDIFEYVKK